jgi:hypothetical protein
VLHQLNKVRYDFVHIPKIGSSKGAVHTIKVMEMSRAFLSAMQVWAEAAGPYESEVDLEVARAFNISRHFAEGGRRKGLGEIVASVAARGGVAIKEEGASRLALCPCASHFALLVLGLSFCALSRFARLVARISRNAPRALGSLSARLSLCSSFCALLCAHLTWRSR